MRFGKIVPAGVLQEMICFVQLYDGRYLSPEDKWDSLYQRHNVHLCN
jgi:hypothetical protein